MALMQWFAYHLLNPASADIRGTKSYKKFTQTVPNRHILMIFNKWRLEKSIILRIELGFIFFKGFNGTGLSGGLIKPRSFWFFSGVSPMVGLVRFIKFHDHIAVTLTIRGKFKGVWFYRSQILPFLSPKMCHYVKQALF